MATLTTKVRVFPGHQAPVDHVQLSAVADALSVLAPDAGPRATKRAVVLSFTVNGQPFRVLVRMQEVRGVLFLDIIASESEAVLDTDVGAMNLAPAVPGHPSPVEDAIDTAAIAEAQP